jgi:protoporphyrinogen oxidase
MDWKWADERIPAPNFRDVVRGALFPPGANIGPATDFWYPKVGGVGTLSKALAEKVNIRYDSEVVGIDQDEKLIYLEDETEVYYNKLVSTIPLPSLIRGLHYPSEEMSQAADSLVSNVVTTVNVGFNKPAKTSAHWIYFSEKEYPFHRVSFPSNFSPNMAPEGMSSVQMEISSMEPYNEYDRKSLALDSLNKLYDAGLVPFEYLSDVEVYDIQTINPAYVIYTLDSSKHTELLRSELAKRDIYTCGRFGDWQYLNIDKAIEDGKAVAERLNEN